MQSQSQEHRNCSLDSGFQSVDCKLLVLNKLVQGHDGVVSRLCTQKDVGLIVSYGIKGDV